MPGKTAGYGIFRVGALCKAGLCEHPRCGHPKADGKRVHVFAFTFIQHVGCDCELALEEGGEDHPQ